MIPNQHTPDSLGPMSDGQRELNARLRGTGATVVEGRLRVTPDHIEQAREHMNRDLERRASLAAQHTLGLSADSDQPEGGSARHEYMSAAEVKAGQRFYNWATEQPAGPNGGPHLTGKFATGWVPGLPRYVEWQTVVADGEAFNRGAVNPHNDPEFLLASAIQANLTGSSQELGGTNFLITYPSPSDPNLVTCSYYMWQNGAYFPRDEQLSPSSSMMTFRFAVPAAQLDRFQGRIAEDPRLLEAMVLASPYGRLMHVGGGAVVRNQANQLVVLGLPRGDYPQQYGAEAARITEGIRGGTVGTMIPINPPVGEVPR